MSLLSSVKNALTVVDNSIQNGKVNVTLQNPVVEVSAEEALKVGKPYIILIAALLLVGVIILAKKRGIA